MMGEKHRRGHRELEVNLGSRPRQPISNGNPSTTPTHHQHQSINNTDTKTTKPQFALRLCIHIKETRSCFEAFSEQSLSRLSMIKLPSRGTLQVCLAFAGSSSPDAFPSLRGRNN
jgi:hypothetical protein